MLNLSLYLCCLAVACWGGWGIAKASDGHKELFPLILFLTIAWDVTMPYLIGKLH